MYSYLHEPFLLTRPIKLEKPQYMETMEYQFLTQKMIIISHKNNTFNFETILIHNNQRHQSLSERTIFEVSHTKLNLFGYVYERQN